LALHYDLLPTTLFLDNVKRTEFNCRGAGGFADVFIGSYKGSPVAIKRIRVFEFMTLDEKEKQKRAFCRESILRKYLPYHRHIMSFLGISQDIFSNDALCIIIPWQEKGSVRNYLLQLKQGPLSGSALADIVIEWLY